MSDEESHEQPPRPLKPILPPLEGGTEPEFEGPILRPLKPILPPIWSREQKEKELLEWREFKQFQKISPIRRTFKRVIAENLAMLVEFGVLTTFCLVIAFWVFRIPVTIASPIGKWKWTFGTIFIVAAGYIVLRGIEGRLSAQLYKHPPNVFVARLIRPNIVTFITGQLLGRNRSKDKDRKNPYYVASDGRRPTFKDIALPEEALDSLKQIIEFIREPTKYQKIGGQIPRGFLLVGPTGIGKTLAASVVAGEANVPFFRLSEPTSNLSEFHEFLDCGPKNAPSILFIDNLDSIARSRSIWPDPQNQNLETITTALFSFLDSQNRRDGVFLIAATNRPDLIDEALIRPGRLTVIEISYPNLRQVELILKIFTRKIPLAEDVDISIIARRFLEMSPNCTGALIAETCNLAATFAAEKSDKVVYQDSFLKAVERSREAK